MTWHREVTAEDAHLTHPIRASEDEHLQLFDAWVVYAEDAAGRWHGIAISLDDAETHEEAALKRAAMTLPSLSNYMAMWVSGPALSGGGRRGMELKQVTVQATAWRVLERDED